jgi:DNA-directed RNA polymerase specialized sigma24 family protein
VNGVNDGQLKKFREADWPALQAELVKYAETSVRRKKWRSGSFLPKGMEAPDLVAVSITKTLNAILGEKKEIATWNEEVNPTIVEHLRGAVDTEIANLLRSEEHKKTNYSALVDGDEAQEIFEAQVDAQHASAPEPDDSVEHKRFEEFRDEVMKELDGDEDTQLLLLTYEELAATNEVVKPSDAAEKMGISVKEIYNLVKKLRRASERVSNRMEEKNGK